MHRHAPDSRAHAQRGVALVAALITVVIVAGLASVLFTTATTEMSQAEVTRNNAELIYLAEAGTVAAERSVLIAVANTLPIEEEGNVAIGAYTVPFTVAEYGEAQTETDDVGIHTQRQHYWVRSRATLGDYRKQVNRMLDVSAIPIFQFAIFYDKDLELHPGPSMTLTGRVHSNADIYLGSGGTLTVASNYLRSVGEIRRMRKENGISSGGAVLIQQTGSTSFPLLYSQAELKALGISSISGYDSRFAGYDSDGDGFLDSDSDWPDFTVGALETWAGSVQTGAHGMKRIEPPSIGSIKRYEAVGDGNGSYDYDASSNTYTYVGEGNGGYRKGRYFASAGLIILDGVAYDNAGNKLLLPKDTILETSMYDAREKKTVKLTEIDFQKLAAGGYMPNNGLIYAARTDASSAAPNGIRIKGGANIGRPLTVVSEDPVYLKGDYNTFNKQPAAIISDAVNLLSNAWNNSKVKGSLPKATTTRFNCAMITGGGETEGSGYCGGFENLPRFHEDWTKIKCNISGSFVKIFAAEIARSAWRIGGDVYWPPERLWDYDTMFNDPTRLPPFTPVVAEVRSSGWWE